MDYGIFQLFQVKAGLDVSLMNGSKTHNGQEEKGGNEIFSPPSSLIYLPTREWHVRETFSKKFIIVPLFSTAQGCN